MSPRHKADGRVFAFVSYADRMPDVGQSIYDHTCNMHACTMAVMHTCTVVVVNACTMVIVHIVHAYYGHRLCIVDCMDARGPDWKR